MREAATFEPMQGWHLLAIERQPSQRMLLGQLADASPEEAAAMAAQRVAWTMLVDGRPLACFGIYESYPGLQGMGWAVLGVNIGRAHHALTRFARAQIAACGLKRCELYARASDIEQVIAEHGPLDPGQEVAVAMLRPTPECRWAVLLGLKPRHVLRHYGPLGETFMLFERFEGEA